MVGECEHISFVVRIDVLNSGNLDPLHIPMSKTVTTGITHTSPVYQGVV